MKRQIIIANWKMNMDRKSALEYADLINKADLHAEVVICPPFTLISILREKLNNDIHIGAQDVFHESKGAYTGEISCSMLKDIGCEYVIIGHSERRQYFNETNESVNKKINSALSSGIIPIMCIGENLSQRKSDKTHAVISSQLSGGLKDIPENKTGKIIIAYEPVWAIGTGINATPEQAQEVNSFIRGLLAKIYRHNKIPLLYGGSVSPENASGLLKQNDIDGLLVGNASLSAERFIEIIG